MLLSLVVLDRRVDLLRVCAGADGVHGLAHDAPGGQCCWTLAGQAALDCDHLGDCLSDQFPADSRFTDGTAHAFAVRHLLLCLMLAFTLISQFWIIPRMDVLRAQVADFGAVPLDNPTRAQFDALHVWSTRVEGAVLLLGLIVVYMTANAFLAR